MIVLLAQISQGLDVRIRLGVPEDHLRVDLHRSDDGEHGRLVVAQELALGVGVAEVDAVVGVLHDGDGLVADGGTAGSELDVDAGVLPASDERAAHDLLVGVDRVALADHLVQRRRARPPGTSWSG